MDTEQNGARKQEIVAGDTPSSAKCNQARHPADDDDGDIIYVRKRARTTHDVTRHEDARERLRERHERS